MKIMSYEIPIYCWQLKRPGTGAAHNFRVPLYLVTNLFRAAGGCWLGLGGSLCPLVPQGRCGGLLGTRTWGPGIWMFPLRRAQHLALRRFQIASKMSAQQRHLSKNKERASFFSLHLHTMRRLPRKTSKIPRPSKSDAEMLWDIVLLSLSIFFISLSISLFLNQSLSFLFLFFLFSLSPSPLFVFFFFLSFFVLILLPKITF